MATSTGRSVDADILATLQEVALLGALDGEAKLSCAALADRLDTSTQTASRRLQRLEADDRIEREIVSDGQLVAITADGERHLRREYDRYRRVFEGEAGVDLRGTVTSGMGEGRHYITLPGYMAQFEDALGYEPFAGTLNLDLDEASIRERARLSSADPIVIEGWEDEERTYGPAYCYPATLETAAGTTYEPAHIITPERTHHDEDQLEVIAPDRLRDDLGLEDGDGVIVRVPQ